MQMAVCCARIVRVELAIHDAVEAHRAGARADHRGEHEQENFPARPAAVVPRRDEHRGECEGQGEDRVREAHEGEPDFYQRKHSTFNIQRSTSKGKLGSPEE